MESPVKQALSSQRVLTPSGLGPAVVLIDGERISGVVRRPPEDRPVVDLGDQVLMPGVTDCHVHINEPGRTQWEGFQTATQAAAAGGITTVVDMPLNCIPVTTSLDALHTKVTASQGQLWVDCAFWGGVVPGNAKELPPMARAGAQGFKCFLCPSGIDDFPQARREDLLRAMPLLREAGVPLLVHAELELPLRGAGGGDERAYSTYLHSRPKEWEDAAISMMLELCRDTGCRVHIVHLSSATALPMLRKAKAEGLPVTVETCPHYLCLLAEQVPDGATEFKCAPPIRESDNREALWQGLADGTIDFVISDHSPCTPGLKLQERGDFMEAWGGIASLQLGLSNLWTEASRRGFTLQQLAGWMCRGPAQFLNLPGRSGAIEAGQLANLVAFAPEESFTLQAERILHRHKLTPYLGKRLRGEVQSTWLRGAKIFHQGRLDTTPRGAPILSPPSMKAQP